MRFPVRAPLRIRRVEGDFILHDPGSGSVHRLNSVAAVIWQLCDGTRDRTSIAAQVAAIFGKSPADVGADIEDILKRFITEGLVYSSAGRREADVLLFCLQTAVGSASLDQTTSYDWSDLDWDYIERTAYQHGVLPLLYRGLRDTGTTLPLGVMQRLEHHFSANTERNEFLLQELLELLDLFEAHDIPAVPLKGPTLAIQLYGDVALRQFGDLDIFIPADRADRAQDLLRSRGCRLVPTRLNVEAEYRGRQGRVNIDLQWAFAPKLRFPVDLAKFWATVEKTDIGRATVLQPTLSDQSRMLMAHAAKHCWSRLIWLSDVAAFINKHQHTLDWSETMEAARDLGAARIVGVSARLAGDLLGTPVPAVLGRAMDADPNVAAIATEVRLRVFAPVKDRRNVRGSYGLWEGGLLFIRTRERIRDKLPFLWHLLGMPVRRLRTIITPNRQDRSVIALPRPIAFLYYLVRPLRLTILYCAQLRERVRN